jgi:hypothetical protein
MSRGAQTLKQGDVTKAVKGAVNAGLAITRVEIDKGGKITIFAGTDVAPMDDLDRELAEFEAGK